MILVRVHDNRCRRPAIQNCVYGKEEIANDTSECPTEKNREDHPRERECSHAQKKLQADLPPDEQHQRRQKCHTRRKRDREEI